MAISLKMSPASPAPSDNNHPVPNAGRGSGLLIAQWVVVSLALTVVLLRLYVRLRKASVGLDDACIAIASGLTVFGAVTGCLFVHYGIGRHVAYLSKHQTSEAIRWLTIAEFESFIGLFFVRTSVAFFLLRLVSGKQIWYKRVIYAAMVLNLAASLAVNVTYGVQCVPLRGLWNRDIHAKCFSPNILTDVNRTFASVSAAIDFLFASLPIFLLRSLNLDIRKKILVCVLIGLGSLTGVCAIGKAITVNLATEDPTWDLVPVTYWAIFEDNIGILVSSLPAIRHIYTIAKDDTRRLLTVLSGSRSGRDGSHMSEAYEVNISNALSQGNYGHNLDNLTTFNSIDLGQIQKSTYISVEQTGYNHSIGATELEAQLRGAQGALPPIRTAS